MFLIRRSFLVVAGALLGGLALAGQVTNNANSDAHPVCVDGVITALEYGNTSSLGFISGSLYQAELNDPLLNSSATGVIAIDDEIKQVNNRNLYMVLAFARRTYLGFGDGDFIADLAFPICVSNINYPNFKLLVRGGPSGTTKLFADYNGDGIPDGLASALGFKGAVGLAQVPNVPFSNVLVVELKIPLLIPPAFGSIFPSFGQAGVYKPAPATWKCRSAADVGLGDQSEMVVDFFGDGKTRLSNQHVPMRTEVDYDPTSSKNVLNTQYRYHDVGLITNYTIDATLVNWTTMRLGDENLPGRFLPVSSRLVDLNGDDRLDRVITFDIATPNNAINKNTIRLLIEGFMLNGDPVAGRDTVRVR